MSKIYEEIHTNQLYTLVDFEEDHVVISDYPNAKYRYSILTDEFIDHYKRVNINTEEVNYDSPSAK